MTSDSDFMKVIASIEAYAVNETSFGGIYLDAGEIVVLFTADISRHLTALRELTSRPDLLRVMASDRTKADAEASLARVRDRLSPIHRELGLVHIGTAIRDGRAEVVVGIRSFVTADISRVRVAAAPDKVLVEAATQGFTIPTGHQKRR